MGYSNMLEYRPNIEAAQLIGSVNPFAAAAKFLGDAADRIRADKVADGDIAYKNSLKSGQDLANDKAARYLNGGGVEKELKQADSNIRLTDTKATNTEAETDNIKAKTQTENALRPGQIEGLNLRNEGQKISNEWAPKINSADINQKNASAYASTTGANTQKFMSLDPYGVQSAQATYYRSGSGLKDAQQSKFNNQLLQ